MVTTSVSLLERLANDPSNSDWTRFLEIYRPLISGQIRMYPDLVNQADDVTQEVVLVLMRELPTFQRQRRGSFRTWLRGIVVNQLRKFSRNARRAPKPAGGNDSLEDQIEQLADPVSEATRRWNLEHDRHVLKKLFQIVKGDFAEQTWTAFELQTIHEQPVAEVANKLGMTENAVLCARSRVLRRLRQEGKELIKA